MEDKKPNVIIVGSGHDAGLLAMEIAELKLANPNCEVVTLEEAKEKGLTQTFEITAPKQFQELYFSDNFFSDGKSARNKRREAERKAKKAKKRFN